MNIEVLVSTIGSGIVHASSVMAPPRDDVKYFISFQYSDESELNLIPDDFRRRSDCRVVAVKSHGLSANRNHALAHATGDILLFADDDNRYTWGDFDRILYVFGERPDADIICFRSATYDGRLARSFPLHSFSLGEMLPRGYYVRSCEMALRRRDGYPQFDLHFGLGSPYLACGEEEVFVHDALSSGFRAYFYPMTIVRTDVATTGSNFERLASVRRSKGAVLAVLHGRTSAVLRAMKYAALHSGKMSRVEALRDMLRGIAYAKKIGRC